MRCSPFLLTFVARPSARCARSKLRVNILTNPTRVTLVGPFSVSTVITPDLTGCRVSFSALKLLSKSRACAPHPQCTLTCAPYHTLAPTPAGHHPHRGSRGGAGCPGLPASPSRAAGFASPARLLRPLHPQARSLPFAAPSPGAAGLAASSGVRHPSGQAGLAASPAPRPHPLRGPVVPLRPCESALRAVGVMQPCAGRGSSKRARCRALTRPVPRVPCCVCERRGAGRSGLARASMVSGLANPPSLFLLWVLLKGPWLARQCCAPNATACASFFEG